MTYPPCRDGPDLRALGVMRPQFKPAQTILRPRHSSRTGRNHLMTATYHPRVTDHTTSGLTGPQRTSQLKAMLQTEREVARSSPRDSYDERVATSNTEDLEALIARSEANDQARERQAAERQAVANAKSAERKAIDDARLKETIRARFMGQPGATEEDFERLYPTLRDQHLLRQSGEAMAQARSRLGRI